MPKLSSLRRILYFVLAAFPATVFSALLTPTFLPNVGDHYVWGFIVLISMVIIAILATGSVWVLSLYPAVLSSSRFPRCIPAFLLGGLVALLPLEIVMLEGLDSWFHTPTFDGVALIRRDGLIVLAATGHIWVTIDFLLLLWRRRASNTRLERTQS